MPSPDNTAPVSLFYSYAHEDEVLRGELAGHLKILERRGLISAWHDRQIVPGQAVMPAELMALVQRAVNYR